MQKNSPDKRDGGLEGDHAWHGGHVKSRLPKTFISFSNPVYRLYYLSMVGHWSSINMQMLAKSLLIYRITGSGALLGLFGLAQAIPMILSTLPGGVAADRIQKKTIIQVGQIASAAISFILTISLVIGYVSPAHPESWWVLMVCGVLQAGVMGFIMPSRSAIINEIVGGEMLMNAISLNNLGMNVFRILSPALAGFLVDVVDFWVVFAINTAMYLMSTLCIIFVPPSPVRTATGRSNLNDIKEGWTYVRHEKIIFAVLMFTVIITILGSPYTQLLPMFTEGILKVSATSMGLLITVSGIGAVCASLIIASMGNKRRGLVMAIFGLVMSVALLGFSFSRWWYVSLALAPFIGAGSAGQMALGNSLIQYYVEASYRGRVMSFFALGFGLAGLGAFFGGILAEAAGVQWAVGSMAMVLIIVSLFFLIGYPKVRRLD